MPLIDKYDPGVLAPTGFNPGLGTGWGLGPSSANPNDPNQQFNWALGELRDSSKQAAGVNLYDPAILSRLSSMLQPYFSQQMGNLNSARASAAGQAGQAGGAYAAAHNLANPLAYSRSNASRVNETFAPQFGELQSSQMNQLLNSLVQNQQFQRSGLEGLANRNLNWAQLANQWRQYQSYLDSQPTFLENLFGGLIQGGAQLGAAYLGRP